MSNKTLNDSDGGNVSQSIPAKFCVACQELIHTKAIKCRYCGTDQQPKPWHNMAQVLKWVGGISAVISLVIGTLRINDLFSDWQERKVAVSQLVNAATLQVESNDYKGAWALINEALDFNPSSQLARQQRIPIAMAWSRNIRTHGNETFSDTVDKLLPTLYQGSVNENPNIAANALTHIGWANYLRSRDGISGLEIDKYYERALKLDPTNTYAHAMWGFWMLWPMNGKQYQDTDLVVANSHFSAALATGYKYEYVKGLQVSVLIHASHRTKVKFELIKVAEEIRENNGLLRQYDRSKVNRIMLAIVAPTNILDQSTQPIFNQLTQIFSPITLLKLSEWLNAKNKNKSSSKMMFNARLEELAGNEEKALTIYQLLMTKASGVSSSYKEFSRQAIKRLSGIN